jgi:zinc transporter 1/2/3
MTGSMGFNDVIKEEDESVDQKDLLVDPDFGDMSVKQSILEHNHHNHQQLKSPIEKKTCLDNFTPFVLLIGLGTHAIFEGIALGINNTFEGVLIFTVAIMLHKGAAGMSLGISMAKTFPDEQRFCAMMITVFGSFTPIGVILGIILGDGGDLLEIIFSSLAAGTFLYIACSEVIVEEFSVPTFKYIKLFAYLCGIAIITCLYFLHAG